MIIELDATLNQLTWFWFQVCFAATFKLVTLPWATFSKLRGRSSVITDFSLNEIAIQKMHIKSKYEVKNKWLLHV